MTDDPLRDVARSIDSLRAAHRTADSIWHAHPVAVFEPVRNELEYQIAALEGIEVSP